MTKRIVRSEMKSLLLEEKSLLVKPFLLSNWKQRRKQIQKLLPDKLKLLKLLPEEKNKQRDSIKKIEIKSKMRWH